MFAQLEVYRKLLVGGLIAVVVMAGYVYVHRLQTQIKKLDGRLKDSYIELANEKLQSTRYKAALDAQNKEIEGIRRNERLAKDRLAKWKALPPKIKYKTIVKIRKVKSDDCEEVKRVIDSVRSIDYDRL